MATCFNETERAEELDSRIRNCCKPYSCARVYRFMTLVFVFSSIFSVYFNYNVPSALQSTIINVIRLDTARYELFYSVYEWPNVVLVLLGGVLIDKAIDLRLAYVGLLAVTTVGSFLFTAGAFLNQYWLMLTGRLVQGSGGEMFLMTANAFVVLLCKDYLSFAFGLFFMVACIAEAINYEFTKVLYDKLQFVAQHNIRLGYVLLLGLLLSLLTLLCCTIAVVLDNHRARLWLTKRGTRVNFSLKQIISLSPLFWVASLIPAFYFVALLQFMSLAQGLLVEKYQFTSVAANRINGLTYLICIPLYPIMGAVIERTGYKISWGIVSLLLNLIAHYMYSWSGPEQSYPIIGSVLLGASFTIFNCSVWVLAPSIAKVHQMTTAYGILFSFYVLMQSIAAILVGIIVDQLGFFFVQLFFSAAISICIVLLVSLYILDLLFRKGELNMSARRQKRLCGCGTDSETLVLQ